LQNKALEAQKAFEKEKQRLLQEHERQIKLEDERKHKIAAWIRKKEEEELKKKLARKQELEKHRLDEEKRKKQAAEEKLRRQEQLMKIKIDADERNRRELAKKRKDDENGKQREQLKKALRENEERRGVIMQRHKQVEEEKLRQCCQEMREKRAAERTRLRKMENYDTTNGEGFITTAPVAYDEKKVTDLSEETTTPGKQNGGMQTSEIQATSENVSPPNPKCLPDQGYSPSFLERKGTATPGQFSLPTRKSIFWSLQSDSKIGTSDKYSIALVNRDDVDCQGE
jgi:hypothetical protein